MTLESISKDNELISPIIEGLQNIKAKNISLLNLRNLSHRCTDYFVICQGESNTQVSSLCTSVEKETDETLGERAIRKEGQRKGDWVLLDYGSVIVHIFLKEMRDHYDIESLWADAERLDLENLD